jgi:hypothetical protein
MLIEFEWSNANTVHEIEAKAKSRRKGNSCLQTAKFWVTDKSARLSEQKVWSDLRKRSREVHRKRKVKFFSKRREILLNLKWVVFYCKEERRHKRRKKIPLWHCRKVLRKYFLILNHLITILCVCVFCFCV